MIQLQAELRERIVAGLKEEFSVKPEDVVFTVPSDRRFGDLSTTLAFSLAKARREKPFVLANQLLAALPDLSDLCTVVKLAGGGFINFTLHRGLFLDRVLRRANRPAVARSQKVIVEHTSINPNKAAHIGHLRNSCLGDTLARGMRFLGYSVEVQNYIDDTGIQVADVIWGLLRFQGKSLEDIRSIPDLASYLWVYYPEFSRALEGDTVRDEERRSVHQRIEEKEEPEYGAAQYVSRQVLLDHIRVMDRLGIRYDLLAHESDIIALDFFTEASAKLKAAGILIPAREDEKKGCWVIPYRRENIDKIVVRSNGTLTYVAKDIAYHLWKFGLLSGDFRYQDFFAYADGRCITATSSGAGRADASFGRADRVFNVIDVRQAYLQNLIGQVLGDLGHGEQSRGFTHYAYEMVALTPACVRELGFSVSEEDARRPYLEVSGRKGIAVKAEELLDKLIDKARQEVSQRHAELDEAALSGIARDIAVAALRYFMIKFTLNTVIAFDFREALSFDGDSGPYLQYTLVRLNSILKKMERLPELPVAAPPGLETLDEAEGDLFWELLLGLAQLEQQVERALNDREPAALAEYAHTLCQKFNHYYHLYPVLAEKDESRRCLRLTILLLFKQRMETLFSILGITVPERM
jgi:arginyl-tRNA synthetase